MARINLFHSVFGRVTLSALLVSLLSTLALFLVVEKIVVDDGRARLAREVDTDLAGLADIYVSGGDTELRARIADRLSVEQQDGEQGWYLLADAQGRRIAGNLDRWPKLSAHVSEARFVTLPDGQRMFARATRLGPSAQLLVGRSDMRGQALLARLAMAFAVAGALIALFSLLVANQGLTQLISVSVPVLVGLYPLAIVLVALSLLDRFWLSSSRVFVPVMAVTFVTS